MPRTRAFKPTEVAEKAMNVFWRQGYEATSVEDLVEATGLSRSSIYQAFGSKQGLFDASLERYLQGVTQLLAPLQGGTGGLDDVVAFFGAWRQLLVDESDASLGCLMVNSIAELAATQPWVREIGDSYQVRLRDSFVRALAVASDRGEIPADTISRRADVLSWLMMGLFIAARGQPPKVIDACIEEAVAEVASWRQ